MRRGRRLIESGTAPAQGLLTAHNASPRGRLEKTMHIRKLSLAGMRALGTVYTPGHQSRLVRVTAKDVSLNLPSQRSEVENVCEKRPVSLTLLTPRAVHSY